MLGKEAIVAFLVHKRISHVFYLPGIHSLPLNQSFVKQKVNGVMGRHEAGIAFAAIGYARATGLLGTVVVTPGPGLGNVTSPCMEAYADQVPLLVIHMMTS